MIYSREKNIVEIVKDQSENISDIKQAQIIGRDNLVVTNYKEEVIESIYVADGAYAEYTAIYTFENAPSDAFVHMTFWYSVIIGGGGGMFLSQYTPPAFIENSFTRKYVFRFAPIGGAATEIDLISYVNTTEPGSLSLVRTL